MFTITKDVLIYSAIGLFGLWIIYLLISNSESFVVMPGELSPEVCMATCAADRQCEGVLYNPETKKCSASKDFEFPDENEIAYRKLDVKLHPNTFIKSDTEERVNVDEIGANGQGLPIDWTQDTNVEIKLTKQDTDTLLQDLEKKRELEDTQYGFSDLDTVYHGTAPEHMISIGFSINDHPTKHCKTKYSNLDALNWGKNTVPKWLYPSNITNKPIGADYNPKYIKVKKKLCFPNISISDCLQKCLNKKDCKKISYDMLTKKCCL